MKTHNATIRVFLTCALLSSISAAHAQDPASAEATTGQAKPNIVLVLMDNFGWGEGSSSGSWGTA